MKKYEAGAAIAIVLLTQAESRLVKLVVSVTDENVVLEIASVLRDLAAVRMQLELPGPTDKRASARVHERAVVCVTRQDGRRIDAALHDISTGGALIESDVEIEEGEECALQFLELDQAMSAVAHPAREGMTHLVFSDLAASQVITLVKHIERHFLRYGMV